MDSFTPHFSDFVTIGLFTLAGWTAIRNGVNKRLSEIEAKQAGFNERIAHVEEFARSASDLGSQISALSAKLDDLRADVTKHNNVIERTYRLESQVEELIAHNQIGGTK